ncbi:winged helix-turn-helix domain-containing protein [Pseudonocardia kongjuensis]|uniref:Winged helix-turn-helix domain-containing protein n=1 Tax=Pseudonocardia kongjuensis TaxID=102227 RepID=A0ABP4IUV6_9PSEU
MPARRPATEAEIAALSSAVRLRIIRLTHVDALTNAELAARLGRDPATTLHHVRRLVAHGFLVAQPARRGARGSREIPYRSTGLSWSLDDAGRHEPVAEAGLEAFLGEVADVGPAALDQTRLVLRLPPERVAALRAELDELLGRYAAEPVLPAAEPLAVYLALYPGDPPGETDRTAARGTWDTRGQDD